MDGNIGSPMVGFDSQSFWQEANAVLARGTREMLINARDKDGLVAAYDRMDVALGELVSNTAPPENVKEDLNHKLNDRISLVGKMMKAGNIDARTYWEADMKSVAMIVLKALGKTRKGIFRIDRLVEDAAGALCEGNYTMDGAKRLIAELSTYSCKNLRHLLTKLEDTPSHMEFLELLVEKGTKTAKTKAECRIACLLPNSIPNIHIFEKQIAHPIPNAMPEKRQMQLANVIQFPLRGAERAPLRHA